jgi:hypothetical protein
LEHACLAPHASIRLPYRRAIGALFTACGNRKGLMHTIPPRKRNSHKKK